jgi:hypothetical protein
MPMPGWRNNTGRPRPRSINSIWMPLTVIALVVDDKGCSCCAAPSSVWRGGDSI